MKSFAMISLLAGLAMATNHEMPAPPAGYVAPPAEYVAPPAEYVAPADVAPPAHVMGAPTIHKVIVGGAAPGADGTPSPILKYEPEKIKANIGDVVEFHFLAKNHTVTQSTFADPCKKMDGGFDTNFMPNPEGKEGVIATYPVETMEPLWFYCKQREGTHCGKGMVFSINAAETGDKTFEIWKALAIQINGTELMDAGIVQPAPAPAAAPSTVSLAADGQATPAPPAPYDVAPASPTVAVGEGVLEDGGACTCHCLCGANSFPADLGVHNFGGYAGMLAY